MVALRFRERKHCVHDVGQTVAIITDAFQHIALFEIGGKDLVQQLDAGSDVIDGVAYLVSKNGIHLAYQGSPFKLLGLNANFFFFADVLNKDQYTLNHIIPWIGNRKGLNQGRKYAAIAMVDLKLAKVMIGNILEGVLQRWS